MGEIADSLINGEFDFITGEYIGKPCGYPRTKDKSLDWEHGHNGHVQGVVKWLAKNGYETKEAQIKVIRGFFDRNTANDSKNTLCAEISQDFGKFIQYVKTLKP